ncbi:BolA family transcriptional regulator [Polynucleobacter sp. SHI8]|nr:BolA family transcriptional regulator [Polynucleobacter sp. SHI2]BDW12474.1 BolA family transcriptional regulator [Polynucleobacter sp. SHI8]
MMYPTPEQIKAYILEGLNCTHISLEGDGQHFFATIVSPEFEGLRPIARHQKVYAALGERMKEEIHALSFKTLTPEEFEKKA